MKIINKDAEGFKCLRLIFHQLSDVKLKKRFLLDHTIENDARGFLGNNMDSNYEQLNS